jgi:hypothetical protein
LRQEEAPGAVLAGRLPRSNLDRLRCRRRDTRVCEESSLCHDGGALLLLASSETPVRAWSRRKPGVRSRALGSRKASVRYRQFAGVAVLLRWVIPTADFLTAPVRPWQQGRVRSAIVMLTLWIRQRCPRTGPALLHSSAVTLSRHADALRSRHHSAALRGECCFGSRAALSLGGRGRCPWCRSGRRCRTPSDLRR